MHIVLKVGAPAPEFEGVDQHGVDLKLSDLAGHYVVLYFYPKDHTPGCTKEAKLFRDEFEDFSQLGAEIIGVSVQDEKCHLGFAERHNLPFRLLADTNKSIARTYKALGLLGFAKRCTYLIGPDGVIIDAYRSELRPGSHVARMKDKLRSLTSSD